MSKQRILYGATVEWSFDAGVTYAQIPEAKGIGIPEEKVNYKDATSLDSVGGVEEFVPGLVSPGELVIPCGYTSGCYEAAVQARTAKTLVYFRSTLPKEEGQSAGDVSTTQGFVSPVIKQNGVGEIIGLDLGVKVSGMSTWTKGAAA